MGSLCDISGIFWTHIHIDIHFLRNIATTYLVPDAVNPVPPDIAAKALAGLLALIPA